MFTEFGLIAHLQQLCSRLPANGFEGIGDDCAVLPLGDGEALVFTADLLVEGIHFLRHASPPGELARKSLHVNLSDVASMGVRPVATLLSVALPPDTMQGDWARLFVEGYAAASEAAGVALIGGDTTASKGEVCINVTAIGRGPESSLKRRSDARPGDIILVAGELGASGTGLKDILAGHPDTSAARIHRTPTAQIEEGVWLGGRREVHAMMDLSDGLASDLKHILDRSGVSAEVNTEQIPIAPASDLETALCGGEDYKLLLTASPSNLAALLADFRARFHRPLHPVGRITAPGRITTPDGITAPDGITSSRPGDIRWLSHGIPLTTDWHGFQHY